MSPEEQTKIIIDVQLLKEEVISLSSAVSNTSKNIDNLTLSVSNLTEDVKGMVDAWKAINTASLGIRWLSKLVIAVAVIVAAAKGIDIVSK